MERQKKISFFFKWKIMRKCPKLFARVYFFFVDDDYATTITIKKNFCSWSINNRLARYIHLIIWFVKLLNLNNTHYYYIVSFETESQYIKSFHCIFHCVFFWLGVWANFFLLNFWIKNFFSNFDIVNMTSSQWQGQEKKNHSPQVVVHNCGHHHH